MCCKYRHICSTNEVLTHLGKVVDYKSNRSKFHNYRTKLSLSLITNSCKTYYIPVQSFKEQFNGIDSTKLRLVNILGPSGKVSEYFTNPLDYLKCIDKNNKPVELKK